MSFFNRAKLNVLAVLLMALGLSSCAYYSNECVNYLGQYTCGEIEPQNHEGGMATHANVYSSDGLLTRYSHKQISHYVEQMAMKMVNNKSLQINAPIAVASFVQFDSTLNRTNILGNQIAESFMHEVHQFGIPVIDFKTTDFLRVTNQGDFVFSRDFLELKDELPIKYVLAGTLVKHQSGYMVNARIIGLTSKAIVASAQGFIPNAVADAIMPSQHNDGIMLSEGE